MKLIKRNDKSFVLYVGGSTFATTHNSPYKKLSLKNCQSIKNGYDFDVEIEMIFIEEEQTGTELAWGRLVPKLDENNCLILRNKI